MHAFKDGIQRRHHLPAGIADLSTERWGDYMTSE